jgi:hypothetical protein
MPELRRGSAALVQHGPVTATTTIIIIIIFVH